MTKDEIRQQIRERRKTLTDSLSRRAGRTIAGALIAEQRLMLTCTTCCLYLSHNKEVSTRSIRHRLYELGKRVVVPVWDPIFKHYDLSELLPGMPVICGPLGIKEPLTRIPLHPHDIDLFIIPALAYDYTGGRLGHGGGYYDRILANANPHALKIGIAYDFQLHKDPLPQEPHDTKVDYVITEKRLINCRAYTQHTTGE